MPRWASLSSIGSGGSSNSANTSNNDQHNNSGLIQSTSHQSISSPTGNPSLGKNSNGSGKFKILIYFILFDMHLCVKITIF